MKKSSLTTSDIMDLISDYKSEVRKLNAKINFCSSRINELESLLNDNAQEQKPTERQKSVKPTFTTPAGTRLRKKETKPRKPYPLSKWDEIILDVIRENNRATLSKDIYDKAFEKAKVANIFMTDDKSKSKINQCLVKLTNRRNDLVKMRYGGRGFAYCYPEWIDEKGRLRREYAIIKK